MRKHACGRSKPTRRKPCRKLINTFLSLKKSPGRSRFRSYFLEWSFFNRCNRSLSGRRDGRRRTSSSRRRASADRKVHACCWPRMALESAVRSGIPSSSQIPFQPFPFSFGFPPVCNRKKTGCHNSGTDPTRSARLKDRSVKSPFVS